MVHSSAGHITALKKEQKLHKKYIHPSVKAAICKAHLKKNTYFDRVKINRCTGNYIPRS